jgi:hypothetical protein
MTSINSIKPDNTNYTIETLLGSDVSSIKTKFGTVLNTYMESYNSTTPKGSSISDDNRNNVYAVLNNIKLSLSNPQRKYFNGAFVDLGTNDKCYNESTNETANITPINCSKLQGINAEIASKNTTLLTKSQRTNVIMKQQQLIEQNEKDILSRQAQYTMAIERNKHRRRLIISVAILNTLLILFYYLMVKPSKFTESTTSTLPLPSAPLTTIPTASTSYSNIGQPQTRSSMLGRFF